MLKVLQPSEAADRVAAVVGSMYHHLWQRRRSARALHTASMLMHRLDIMHARRSRTLCVTACALSRM